jgi:hypothetical protein
MKKLMLYCIVLLSIFFCGCDITPSSGSDTSALTENDTNSQDGDDTIPEYKTPYLYDGSVEVISSELSGTESFGVRMIGNTEGNFISAAKSAKSIAGNTIISIPEILKRYKTVDFVEKKSYSFSSFKLVADIMLKPDHYFSVDSSATTDILYWGGDESDLSQYIDLISGEFKSTTQPYALYKTVYNSVLIQINAPASTILPDFGSDVYDKTAFSWSDLKPFYSTTSSTQNIVYSTYVTEPFVKWIGVKSANFDSLATVLEHFSRRGRILDDFVDWAYNAIMNQEFFDEIESLNLTEDPHTGEAWIFMPLKSAIDLTAIDKVTFSFELYMKHLMEVYKDAKGRAYYMLGVSKNFKNSDGDYFFGPLPLRISYKSNSNGFTVNPLP